MKVRLQIILILLLSSLVLSAQEEVFYSIQMAPFSTSENDEYSPVFYEDGIVFCSNRKADLFINYRTDRDKRLFNLYKVNQIDRNSWGKPTLLSKSIRTNFHEGSTTFSNNDNLIYFTRNIEASKKIGNSINRKNKVGIYTAELSGNNWTNIEAFEYNDSLFNFGHPSLSPDGKKLFFVSDKEGGIGGTDIYVCSLNNGLWSEPENIGTAINTDGDEKFPFIHSNGKLYFSSTGHNSMGRLDIYYSIMDSGKWEVPYHFKEPINSRFDDFGLIMNSFEKAGLFSSNRRRSDDIYSFISVFPIFENTKLMERNDYCFVFYETSSYDIDTMNLSYEWDLGDGTKVRGLEAEHCFNEHGAYTIKLNIIDGLTGEVYFNEATYDFLVEDIEQVYINSVDTCIVNEKVPFDGLKTNLKDFEINEYFWSFSDGWKSKGAEVEHVFKSPGSYIVQLGVTNIVENKDEEKKVSVYKNIVVLSKSQSKNIATNN